MYMKRSVNALDVQKADFTPLVPVSPRDGSIQLGLMSETMALIRCAGAVGADRNLGPILSIFDPISGSAFEPKAASQIS